MRQVPLVFLILASGFTALPAIAADPGASARPVSRANDPSQASTAAWTPTQAAEAADTKAPEEAGSQDGLTTWVAAFRSRALAEGIDAEVFDAALKNVRYDEDVIRRDRNQSEFTKTIWDYLKTATSDLRIENGKAALGEYADTLNRIEDTYGVEKEVVTAIWGLESAYGSFRGSNRVIDSLATLAYDARRPAFFEGELLNVLRILQAEDVEADRLTGSWAGAMGHTQFMPSSFLAHAVDFTQDGRRDIWGDDPTDALASTAAYLKHFGWEKGQPWGVEVRIPEGFDYLLADREITKSPSEWAALGVTDLDGNPVPDHGPASVLLPGGAKGAAFLIFPNFSVIERYNTADAYVVAVGHLSDRLRGAGPIRQPWPLDDRALTYDERIELQTRLTEAGFDTKKIDAKIGPLTIDAVRSYQKARGLLPDGYASLRLLERLRDG
jgi:membrane-bound lytic murein transglycosylase B